MVHTGQLILAFIAMGCVPHGTAHDLVNGTHHTAAEQEPGDISSGEPPPLADEHQAVLDDIDEKITHVKHKIGKLYSQNSALLHRLNKLDEYIKRGVDMETRYVIEISGYPFDQKAVPPEEFLDRLAVVLGISNFTQAHVKGLRLMAGVKFSSSKLVVEFYAGKAKKTWLRAYKKKLYEISWGDAEKVFGTKETYKTFNHKVMYLQDLLPTLCEMYACRPTPFAINEYISPYRKKLLSYAKLLAAHYQYRYVWVSEGDIFVRKKDGEKGTYIRSEKDFRLFDWRLDNEKFFWQVLNECNVKRREVLMKTTRRILPWMKTVSRVYEKPEWITDQLRYKRKHHNHIKFLINRTETLATPPPDIFNVMYTHKVNTYIMTNRSSYSVLRNIDL